jgi:hypothetical protein
LTVSSPACPSIVSLPPSPVIESLPSPPKMLSLVLLVISAAAL